MYKISITKVTSERKLDADWVKLWDTRPAGVDPDADQYGYRKTEREVESSKVIYTQEVDTLDLVAVIQAVNKQDDTVHIKFDHGRVFGEEKRA